MKNLILIIKERFELALEAKNGWGKNEIKTLLDNIIIQVLSESIENK